MGLPRGEAAYLNESPDLNESCQRSTSSRRFPDGCGTRRVRGESLRDRTSDTSYLSEVGSAHLEPG